MPPPRTLETAEGPALNRVNVSENHPTRASVLYIGRHVVFELVLVAVVDSGLIARARFQLKFLSGNSPLVRVVRRCTALL